MAAFNPQTQKCLLPLATFFFLLFLNPANSYEEVCFLFREFTPKPQLSLITQGDVIYDSNGWLRFNERISGGQAMTYNAGRVLHSAPIHIWDSVTGNVANFETSFSLFVRARNANRTADGATFFIAPMDSQIPAGSVGGYLGVFTPRRDTQVVAVEFDTFSNPWDPGFPHIGININNTNSIRTVRWGFQNTVIARVNISYESNTKTLTASLSHSGSSERFTVSAVVDIKINLPEWVRVGFSATTGLSDDYAAHHYVTRWWFSSNIESYSRSGADLLKNPESYKKNGADLSENPDDEGHIALYADES